MKINFVNKPSYAEEGQPNPIRWAILSGNPEQGFTNETSWLKCKDFFNDYCYTYNTRRPVAIYGFNTGSIKVAKKGEPVYIAVKDITSAFNNNLICVNEWLEEQGFPNIKYSADNDGDEHFILCIPPFFFNNTYNISLISLIIRLCNVEHAFAAFEEMKAYKDFPHKDQQKWSQVVKKGIFFNLPASLQKYVWYAGEEYNSETMKDGYGLASAVHNNGVLSYGRYM